MTNASIKSSYVVLSAVAIALVLTMGAFATTVHAQEDDWSYPTADSGADWSYSGAADDWSYPTADSTADWSYSGGGDDWAYPTDCSGCDDWSYPTESDWSYPTYDCNCDYVYEDGIGYTYQDYGYSSGSSYGGGYSSGGGGYSQPISFSAPRTSYSSPVYYQQQQQQQQTRTISAPGNTTNTSNYCTNNSCNSNSTVTISNSGNTSNVTTVTPVRSGSTQYAVQYVYPQTYTYPTFYPTYNYNTASCYISSSGNYISWAASGATSAWLSGVGSVSPTGSMAVSGSGTYTLTVSGPGGSNTCSTYVSVINYNYGTSVSLSQIPYTGFDFGPIGNALYWLALLAFAAAGAYLLVYYRGGISILANSMLARTTSSVVSAPVALVKSTAQKIENVLTNEHSTLEKLPVAPSVLATTDSMTIARSKDGGAPRIIISRA